MSSLDRPRSTYVREPVDDLDFAPQLKHDLAYERANWDTCVDLFCTDFERYDDLIEDIVGFVPNSRFDGSGGDDPDAVIKHLLRGLSVRHRLVIEYRYGLWDGAGFSARLVAAALGMTERGVERKRSEGLDLLRVHRDELLLGLGRASASQLR